MSCPVCGLTNIQDEQEKCPQCDAELTCFKVLDRLTATPPAAPAPATAPAIAPAIAPAHRQWSAAIITAGISVALIALAISLYLFYILDRRLTKQEVQFTTSVFQLNSIVSELLSQQAPKESLEATSSMAAIDPPETVPAETTEPPLAAETIPPNDPSAEFFVYQAHDEDTLWAIAARFYGSGHYYPVILEHNPDVEIFRIKDGIQLRLLNHKDDIDRIYRQIIVRKEKQLFWRYTVKPGDTMGIIANRFFKDQGSEQNIVAHNPDVQLEPGQKIKILLK